MCFLFFFWASCICCFVKSIYWVSFAFWEMFCLLEFVFCFALRDQAQRGGLVPTDNEQPGPFQKDNNGRSHWEKNQIWFVFSLSLLESDSDFWLMAAVKRDDGCTAHSPGWEHGKGRWRLPRKVLPWEKNSATSRRHFCSQTTHPADLSGTCWQYWSD